MSSVNTGRRVTIGEERKLILVGELLLVRKVNTGEGVTTGES